MTRYAKTMSDAFREVQEATLNVKSKYSKDKKVTKKEVQSMENDNEHGEVALALALSFGTPREVTKVRYINKMHKARGEIIQSDQKERDAIIRKYYKMAEEVELQEDGHDDVASAIRQCKTVTEDAMQILQKLQSMSPEGTLPTWWSNKLAIASNSMNKIRDYLLVPSVAEGLDLNEKAGDHNDLKKLVGELQNASKMHLAQSKRVKAHVDMMKAGDLKGTLELVQIVRELEKASEAHLRQSKAIANHMKEMGESNINEQMEAEDSLKNWKHDDAKSFAEELIEKYGKPDEVTQTMIKYNKLGAFGDKEMETYVIDESIPHSFPDPHKDFVYTVMEIKVPSDMLDTLGHVTGSIVYDGLKETVTARCGSLEANALTLQFVKDLVEGKIENDNDVAKKTYADRIRKGPLPKSFTPEQIEGIINCGHNHKLDEAMKYTHAVVDPDGKVAGMSTNEKDAKDIASRHKGKVVTLKNPMSQKKGDMMINRPFKEEVELDEAKFSPNMIDKLRKAYEPMKGKKINPTPLMKIFDKIDSNKDGLIQLYKADIPFVSTMALSRLTLKHNMNADEIKKLKEDVDLDEKKDAGKSASGYDIFHKDFSSAMQHATAFAKKKGQPIKKDEIDNKVATGPKKPSKGKENSYNLETEKGKSWSIQVYNMDGKKYELNMYLTSSYVPEENEMNEKNKLKSGVKFDFQLFDDEDSPGSDKANADMNKEIVKAVRMKDKETARQYMMKVQKKHSKHGATDTEPREVINQILDAIFEAKEKFEEGAGKYSKMNLDKAKKLMGPSKNREQGIKMVMKGLGTTYKHATQLVDTILGVNPKTGKIESAELDEGYESEVKKVLDKEGIDGYFKNGKLYVSKRDAKDAKKALEDSDEITKLPIMVKEENDMTKDLKETIMDMWKEAVSPAQQAAIAISKKEKDEGNAFTGALNAAKEKGEKTFTVAGKEYDVKTEKLVGGQKKLDKDKDGDIDGKDFAMMRKKKTEDIEHERQRYLETKKGSVRESILKMWGEVNEKVEYVEYKFKSERDAKAAKQHLDGMKMMSFDINDDNIRGGELSVDSGKKDMTKAHKEIMQKFKPKVMKTEKKDLTKNEKDDSVKKTDTGMEMTPVDMSPKLPKVKESKNKV